MRNRVLYGLLVFSTQASGTEANVEVTYHQLLRQSQTVVAEMAAREDGCYYSPAANSGPQTVMPEFRFVEDVDVITQLDRGLRLGEKSRLRPGKSGIMLDVRVE